MFGPLPRLHRLLVVLTSLVVGITAGIWIVRVTDAPALIAAGGLGWGLLSGIVLTAVLLHDFHRTPRPVRARRH